MANVGSATKFAPIGQEGFTTALASNILSGAATVPLDSVAGYANGDTVCLVVDPGNASKQVFTGVVDTSGVQITGVVWTEGANTAHTIGATVTAYVTATESNLRSKGFLVSHNADGTLKSGVITTQNMLGANIFTDATVFADAVDPVLRAGESEANFIASGCVWSGDNYGSSRNASMTVGVVYIDGYRFSLAIVTSHAFTASKDTYIDVTRSGATAAITYTEVANNAASPALAASSIRIGIVVTGGSSIVDATRINQGQPSAPYPTSTNVGKAGIDSLGNKIHPHSGGGALRFIANDSLGGFGNVLNLTFPLLRAYSLTIQSQVSFLWQGTPAVPTFITNYLDSAQLTQNRIDVYSNNDVVSNSAIDQIEVAAGSHTVQVNIAIGGGGVPFSTGSVLITATPI